MLWAVMDGLVFTTDQMFGAIFTPNKIPLRKTLTLFKKSIHDVAHTYYVSKHKWWSDTFYLISKEGYIIRVQTNTIGIIDSIRLLGHGINAVYGSGIKKTCERVGRRHNFTIFVREEFEAINMFVKLY